MNFSDRHFLLALAVLPVMAALVYVALRKRKEIIKRMGDAKLVNQLFANFSYPKYFIKIALLLIAFTSLVVAVANLQEPKPTTDVSRKGVDVMLALDVSKSMLAKDVSPDRLTRAKLFMNRLVEVLKDDRIGIILFAGRAYLQMPLSTDHSAASMYIQQASPESVPTQGTVLSEALRLSASAFVSKERKYKSIIVITDGEDHDPAAIPVAQELLSNGIMINTIGIGSPEGTTIIDPETGTAKTDPDGNIVVSKLNESILKQLASSTNGIYLRLDNPEDAIRSIVQQLGTIEKTAMADSEFKTFKSYYQYFVGIALILLILELLMSERKKDGNKWGWSFNSRDRKSKAGERAIKTNDPEGSTRGRAAVVSVILMFVFFHGNAQTVNQSIYKGNQFYRKGEFQKAIEEYRKAQKSDPDNSIIQYNLANALYRTNQLAEAERLYNEAIEKKEKQPGSINNRPGPTDNTAELNRLHYNNGLAQTKQKKLEESIASYKQALIYDPTDADARFNLQKALSERKPPPQEQQSKKEQQKKKERQQQNKSKLNKKQVENLLKALQQREQEAQRKMQQNRTRASSQPEKDW